MADFVKLLKKAIDAQSNPTVELRQRIYDRARETVEKKLATSNVNPEIIELQRRIFEKAIHEVEALFRDSCKITEPFRDRSPDKENQLKKERAVASRSSLAVGDQEKSSIHLHKDFSAFAEDRKYTLQALFDSGSPRDKTESYIDNGKTFVQQKHVILQNDEGTGEEAPAHDALKASFVEELFADVSIRQQEAAGTLAFVSGISVAEKTEPPQKAQSDTKDIESLVSEKNQSSAEQHIHIDTPASSDESENSGNRKKDDNSSVVSNLFAQAAIREKKRTEKKRILAAGVIIVSILGIVVAISWFLTGFLQKEELRPVSSVDDILVENMIKGEHSAKITQRLMPDGQETDPGSSARQEDQGEGAGKTTEFRMSAQTAEAILHESSTDIQPRTTETGFAKWLILHEKTGDDREEMAIRGDISIPGKDMMLRMIIRRNLDRSIPAAYLIEMIFVVPENFHGGGIDRIGQLLFKASRQSSGQLLQGTVAFKIDDNFFVLAMNAPKPLLERNLGIMRQLPWMGLNIAYKNGQTGELSFAKGSTGDAVFKQVLNKSIKNEKTDSSFETGAAFGR